MHCRNCNTPIDPSTVITSESGFDLFYQCPNEATCGWHTQQTNGSPEKGNQTPVYKLFRYAPYDLVTNDIEIALKAFAAQVGGVPTAQQYAVATKGFILRFITDFAQMNNMDEKTLERYCVLAGIMPSRPTKEFTGDAPVVNPSDN